MSGMFSTPFHRRSGRDEVKTAIFALWEEHPPVTSVPCSSSPENATPHALFQRGAVDRGEYCVAPMLI